MSFPGDDFLGNYEHVRGNTDQGIGLRQTFQAGKFSVIILVKTLSKNNWLFHRIVVFLSPWHEQYADSVDIPIRFGPF